MEAEEAQHAQAILGDALLGIADEAHAACLQVGLAVEVVVDRAGAVGVERVEGEVAAARILAPVVGEGDDGVAAVGLDVAAQGRELERAGL